MSAVFYFRNYDTEVEMGHYQTVFALMVLGVTLSACNGGSAVTESDQVANSPAQETAVSDSSGTVTNTPTESNTTTESEQPAVVSAPPVTTTTTPVSQGSTSTPTTNNSSGSTSQTQTTPTEPVSETPAPADEPVADTPAPADEPVAETPAPADEPVAETPAPVVGAASLSTASISGDNVILRWNQTNDVPEGGYSVVVDGANAGNEFYTNNTSITITGLDLTAQHCFAVQAHYTQLTPAQVLRSNSLCTEAQAVPNQVPVISGTPALSVDVGGSYSFTPNATDDDNDNLTFSVTNRPSWAQFDSRTGRLSGTPDTADVGDYNSIVISVSDGTDEVSLAAFNIAVNPVVSQAPATGSISLSWAAPRTRTDGTSLSLAEIKGYCIYVGTTRDNLEMVVDLTDGDRTTYVLDNLEVGDYYVAVSVYDQQENMSNYSNIVLKTAVN